MSHMARCIGACFLIWAHCHYLCGLASAKIDFSYNGLMAERRIDGSGADISLEEHWISAPGYVDLSGISFKETPANIYHFDAPPFHLGVLVTRRDPYLKYFVSHYLECCDHENMRQGKCSALDEMLVETHPSRIKKNYTGEEEIVAFFSVVPSDETQHFSENQTRVAATKSGRYEVQYLVCHEGRGHWSTLRITGGANFVAMKRGGYLISPDDYKFLFWYAFSALLNGSLAFFWLFPRLRAAERSKPQLSQNAFLILAISALEATLLCLSLFFTRSTADIPAFYFQLVILRLFRAGATITFVLALALGSEVFRRGHFQEPWILGVAIFVMALMAGSYIFEVCHNLVFLVSAFATLKAFSKSREHFLQSASASHGYGYYQKIIFGLIVYWFVLPFIFNLECTEVFRIRRLYGTLSFVLQLKLYRHGHLSSYFWHFNTAWFCYYSIRSHNGAVKASSESELVHTNQVQEPLLVES